MLVNITTTAGKRLELSEVGDFFRLMKSTNPVKVEYYFQGRQIAQADGVGSGYAEKFLSDRFDRIAITSDTAQALQFVSRLGNEVSYDAPPTGDVNIAAPALTWSSFAGSVYPAGTAIAVERPTRRYLLIQNNHATETLSFSLTGHPMAGVDNRVHLLPGDSFVQDGLAVTPKGINAWTSAAVSHNMIHLVEAY